MRLKFVGNCHIGFKQCVRYSFALYHFQIYSFIFLPPKNHGLDGLVGFQPPEKWNSLCCQVIYLSSNQFPFSPFFFKPKQPQLSVLYFSILFLFVFKLPSSKLIDFFCLFIMSPRLHKFCSQTFGWLSIPSPLTCFYALLVYPPLMHSFCEVYTEPFVWFIKNFHFQHFTLVFFSNSLLSTIFRSCIDCLISFS